VEEKMFNSPQVYTDATGTHLPLHVAEKSIADELAGAKILGYLDKNPNPSPQELASATQLAYADTRSTAHTIVVQDSTIEYPHSIQENFQLPRLAEWTRGLSVTALTVLGLSKISQLTLVRLGYIDASEAIRSEYSQRKDSDDPEASETEARITISTKSAQDSSSDYGSRILTMFAAAASHMFNPIQETIKSTVSILSSFKDTALEMADRAYKGAKDYIGNILQSLPPARSIIAEMRKSFHDAAGQLTDYARVEMNEAASSVASLMEKLKKAGLSIVSPDDVLSARPGLAFSSAASKHNLDLN